MTHPTPWSPYPATTTGPAPAPRRPTAIELGVLQGAFVLFLVPWFFLAIGGTMGLANWESILAAFVILAWWSYPLVAVVTSVVAWVLFGVRRLGAARWVNRVPLVWVLVGVVLLAWIAVAG
ncbi:hypothetical protein [Candidatus Blastococcus massiliensis]|uniref:hypothetical protein n=1 Tax=Candidatus Blastococcus massiliensis TaxID=1470358 RepID=UPI0012DC3B60|nr:hypothetical protein [Candidatus Blastococcus massiliensis]